MTERAAGSETNDKLCSLCKYFHWDSGSGCPTCGYSAELECLKGRWSKYPEDAEDFRRIERDCDEFEFADSIKKLIKELEGKS